MTEPLSRVEFIRRIQNRSIGTPVTGRNPYADEFGILPDEEIRRLVVKHSVPPRRGPKQPKNQFTRQEIADLAGVDGRELTQYVRGENSLSRNSLRRLCRLLKQLEEGWIVKIAGYPVMLFKPRPPPAEIRFHVGLDILRDGRMTPRIVMNSQLGAAPKMMPRLFSDFSPGKRR